MTLSNVSTVSSTSNEVPVITANTMSEQVAVLTGKQIIADNAKKRSLMILARSVLFDADGEVITASKISKADSTISMIVIREDIGSNLSYFHSLGFLHSSTISKGSVCVANVANSFKGTHVKLNGKVLSELIAVISKVLRAASKELISVMDAGKFIARLVTQLKQIHSAA